MGWQQMKCKIRGFSISELLILITIIAILAAIAVPNYMEAHVATDVAQAKSDLHTLVEGLEAYRLDNVDYPRMNSLNCCTLPPGFPGDYRSSETLERLTTPIAYLNTPYPFSDPFEPRAYYYGPTLQSWIVADGSVKIAASKQYFYTARGNQHNGYWNDKESTQTWFLLESSGPDRSHNSIWYMINAMPKPTLIDQAKLGKVMYDPTNGTISRGSIWNYGGTPIGSGTILPIMIDIANSSAVSNWEDWE